MTIFNIMTNDDWYHVYVNGNVNGNRYATHIYIFLMIIIINISLLGLALAIILDGFTVYLDKDFSSIENLENYLLKD